MSKEATLQSDECGVCWARDGGSPRLPRASAASNACARLYLALLLWGKTDGEDEPEAREKLTEDEESFCSLEQ
jgi:hypothetical protein